MRVTCAQLLGDFVPSADRRVSVQYLVGNEFGHFFPTAGPRAGTEVISKCPEAVCCEGRHVGRRRGIEGNTGAYTFHYLFKLLAVRRRGADEALAVKELKQGGEALGIAVVRRGRQKQPVLKVRRKLAQCLDRKSTRLNYSH